MLAQTAAKSTGQTKKRLQTTAGDICMRCLAPCTASCKSYQSRVASDHEYQQEGVGLVQDFKVLLAGPWLLELANSTSFKF